MKDKEVGRARGRQVVRGESRIMEGKENGRAGGRQEGRGESRGCKLGRGESRRM